MSCVSDPIADFLTRLRNASRSRKAEVVAPFSTMKGEIARILQEEGFVDSVQKFSLGGHPQIRVLLKYNFDRPVITNLRRVSRPGLRKYVSALEIPRVLSGIGVSILSTSSGVMSSRTARRRNIGGEVLAFVW